MSICSSDRSLKIVPFSSKKLKSSIKIAFCIESKAEFLVELKTQQFKKLIYIHTKAKHGDISKTYENPSWLGIRMELKFVTNFATGDIWV